MTLPRGLILGLAGVVASCASTPTSSETPESPPPFVKMAQRELGILLHWRGQTPLPAHLEVLGRALERGFADTYRVPVTVVRRGEPFRGIPPVLLVHLAKAGIDDAIVVEARRSGPEGPLEARVEVVALATQEVLHTLPVRASERKARSVAEELRRFAGSITSAVRRRWTAPGAAPEMDPLLAAHHLFEKGACHHAAPLFDLALSQRQLPVRADRIAHHEKTRERRRACREQLALEARVAEDRAASFRFEVRSGGVSKRIPSALRRHDEALRRELRARTDKPAILDVESGTLTLTLRHARRAGQPDLDRASEPPRVDLEPLRPVFDALLGLREDAARDLGDDLGLLLSRFGFRVRLEHLLGSALVFEFVEVGEAPVLAPRATLERRGAQVILHARSREDLRDGLFQLGPFVDARGRPTEDAWVGDFFAEGSTPRR